MKNSQRWKYSRSCMLQVHWITIRVAVIFWSCFSTTSFAQLNVETCGPGIFTAGWTVPKGDIILEVGNSLEIFCHLNPEIMKNWKVSAENIIFYEADRLMDSHYFTVVNETTAKLSVDNLTVANYMFYCKLSLNKSYISNSLETFSDSAKAYSKEEKLVCLNTVYVGSKPSEVLNFSCTSYNWKVLNCTWVPPYNSIRTEYSIQYQTPKRSGRGQSYKCPNNDDVTHNYCVWTETSTPSYRRMFEYLAFTLNGTNKLGKMTQSIRIHHFAHVVPDAPQSLTMISKTSSSIYLQFGIGALSIFEKGFTYKVEYIWNSSSTWHTLQYEQKDVTLDGDKVRLNVTDLKYPNVAYDFRIYMKSSIALGDTGWSPPASIVLKTKACAPFYSPKTDVGNFEILIEHANYRSIFVYWKQVPVLEHNGDNFHYEVAVKEGASEVAFKPEAITSSYAKLANMNLNAQTVFIRSVNAEGRSKEASVVFIPNQKDLIPDPIVLTKIDYGNDVYELAWKPPNVSQYEITNFTTFWCESNRERPFQCDGYTDWIHLPATATKHNFTIKSINGFQFAISANSPSSTSGMKWAACTVMHDKINKMKTVWTNRLDSHFIDIKWKLDCSERVDNIQGFHLFYCVTSKSDRAKCAEPEKVLTVYGDVTTNHGNITNLKPNTDYKVQVSIFVTDGRVGPRSDEIFNSTLEGAPDVRGLKVEARHVTNTTAKILWEPPITVNGILRNYEVHYNDNMIRVNNTQALLTNLISYDSYNVQVRACTSICSDMIPIIIHTKIGVPGFVSRPIGEKINASHAVVSWDPPTVPAGPSPTYDVRIQFDDFDKNSTITEFETSETKAVVPIPNCKSENSHLSYTFYVRAKNLDNSDYKNIQYFVGAWSAAWSINCIHTGLSVLWRIMLGISLFVFLLSIFVYWGRKGVYKCQQMKKIEVTLPPKFIIPPLFQNDVKETDYHVNIRTWSDGNTESDHLNSKLADLDQSSIDCIDLDLDTDRETDKSSSGCYTG